MNNQDRPPVFYITTGDFALTTWRLDHREGVVSGPDVRRIGLTAPWEDLRAWRRLVREVLPDIARPRVRERVAAKRLTKAA